MLPLGSGPTRATLAWLSGALMACGLIATCLLVLRSDVLPFQGSWPSLQGSRAGTTELAPPPARVTGAGTGGVTALIPATSGAAIPALPGVGALPIATPGPVATGNGNGSTSTEQTTGTTVVGDGNSSVPSATGTTPAIGGSTLPTTPATSPATSDDTAPVVADAPDTSSSTARPHGRTSDGDAGRAEDHPPAEADPGTDDSPASPV